MQGKGVLRSGAEAQATAGCAHRAIGTEYCRPFWVQATALNRSIGTVERGPFGCRLTRG